MARGIGTSAETALDRSVDAPTSGSGSLPIKPSEEVPDRPTIFGNEMDVGTWMMARMNMILHGYATHESPTPSCARA